MSEPEKIPGIESGRNTSIKPLAGRAPITAAAVERLASIPSMFDWRLKNIYGSRMCVIEIHTAPVVYKNCIGSSVIWKNISSWFSTPLVWRTICHAKILTSILIQYGIRIPPVMIRRTIGFFALTER